MRIKVDFEDIYVGPPNSGCFPWGGSLDRVGGGRVSLGRFTWTPKVCKIMAKYHYK